MSNNPTLLLYLSLDGMRTLYPLPPLEGTCGPFDAVHRGGEVARPVQLRLRSADARENIDRKKRQTRRGNVEEVPCPAAPSEIALGCCCRLGGGCCQLLTRLRSILRTPESSGRFVGVHSAPLGGKH